MKSDMMLFQPGKVGNLTLKNRVVMAPMGSRPDIDGGFKANEPYLVARAKGGCGMIITGCTTVSDEFEKHPTNAHYSFAQNARLGTMCEKIHAYGCKLNLQLSPGIGRMNFVDPFTPPYSSSPVPSYAFPDLICKEMPADGLKRLAKAMGYSAQLAKQAGVDAVEVHAYGGYLIDQFNSSYWNHRTDEYGGSFENRTRFMREIIESIRKFCGDDFPITVKMTLDSIYPKEERPKEEGLRIAKMIADMGVEGIHIGRGSYFCRYRMVSSVYQEPGFDMDAVKEIKELFPDTPIFGHGKMNHPELAEKAIREGYMDYVVIGHGMLADPDWANKVRTNRNDEIIPCIGCGECHYQAMKGKVLSCAVNPRTGHEDEYQLTPATSDKNILVIGGGPGGMTAALTAVKRGFHVTLWEKNYYLGGEMKAAGAPYCKSDVDKQVEYLKRQMSKYNIDVKLGFTATVDAVKEFNPDYVVVASGTTPLKVKLPGSDLNHVMQAEDYLLKRKPIGQKIIIVGGGLVGCETALDLAHNGKDVTIVEMMDDVLKTAAHFVANDQNLRYLLEESTTKVMLLTKLKEIKENCVVVETADGVQEVPCDNVLFAVGFKSDHTLYQEIYDAGFECVQVGDNVKPGKILDAIHQAYHYIRVLE